MPVGPCSSNGKPGFKWGDSGKCYTYTEGDDASRNEARRKAGAQGAAAHAAGYMEKENEVTTGSMSSGIKNPQQGYPKKKKPKMVEEVEKSLKEWFRERWVDISRPKPGGGFEPCGRRDASTGKYPKCVPASRAARMSDAERRSAVQRKRRAESTQSRDGKKPINVPTEKMEKRNVPTNPALYARVKAEAKRKFSVYPSAYANAWLVREYKKRGGGYRTVSKGIESINKIAEDLDQQEALLGELLIALTAKYGKFNEDETGVWAGYDSAEDNDVADIGVKCENCIMYEGNGICKIIAQTVEPEGKCRFAIIPDGVVEMDNEKEDDEESDSEEAGSEEESDDLELDLKPRQQMHYEVLEAVAEKYGKWDQSSGANGAHYAPASANPFKDQGMICANCVFYEGGQGCEIVSGTIEPEAICKLWIINESLIRESE